MDIARAILALAELRREGAALPKLQRIGRLHIVMPVEQQMRRGWGGALMMRDGDRMPRCFRNTRLEADPRQISRKPFGCPPAFRGIGRIRRDRLIAHQMKEALERSLEIIVQMQENSVKLGQGHGMISEWHYCDPASHL